MLAVGSTTLLDANWLPALLVIMPMDAPNKGPNKPTNSGVRPKGAGESGMGMGKVTGAGIVVVGHRYDCLTANNQSI